MSDAHAKLLADTVVYTSKKKSFMLKNIALFAGVSKNSFRHLTKSVSFVESSQAVCPSEPSSVYNIWFQNHRKRKLVAPDSRSIVVGYDDHCVVRAICVYLWP